MFAFLPANIICYFLSRNLKTKNIILIVFSLLFYAWGEPVCVALLIFSSFIGYIFAIAIDKSETKQQKKLYLIISLIINLGLLGIFKYAGFFVSNINYLLHVNLPVPQISYQQESHSIHSKQYLMLQMCIVIELILKRVLQNS